MSIGLGCTRCETRVRLALENELPIQQNGGIHGDRESASDVCLR